MSKVLRQFEQMVNSRLGTSGKAIQASAKKHPAGYRAWIKGHIAGTPYTAAGFDQARASLEAAGLTKIEALRECCREHPAHGLWLTECNESRTRAREQQRDQREQKRGRGTAPAPAPASPAAIAAPSPIASGSQRNQVPTLSADDLAELRARWEKSTAFRAAWGDDFNLLRSCREGRVTWEEAKAFRAVSATKQSREMWASWDAQHGGAR